MTWRYEMVGFYNGRPQCMLELAGTDDEMITLLGVRIAADCMSESIGLPYEHAIVIGMGISGALRENRRAEYQFIDKDGHTCEIYAEPTSAHIKRAYDGLLHSFQFVDYVPR